MGFVKIITTHLTADFDAFAAALAVRRLFPQHRVVFPGSLELAVRRFVEGTGFEAGDLRLREVRRETIEHAVVVDTRSPRRLGEVWELLSRSGARITLIDHHPDTESGIEADEDRHAGVRDR